jgi:hypothetical protein
MISRTTIHFLHRNDKTADRGSARLVQLGLGLLLGANSLLVSNSEALATSPYDTWYFTAEEVGAAHQYQENYGERIRNPLPARECLFGQNEFAATYQQTEFLVPCRFIMEITRHLKEMLAVGAAKYLFPLDADHGHLGIPGELWTSKYSKLPSEQIWFALLREPKLIALYHTAEHLEISDPKNGKVNEEAKAWKEKRNVLGFLDGRPIEILPPHPAGQGVGMPPGYNSYGGFNFLANPRGELFLFVNNKVVTFDVSLDMGDEAERPYLERRLIRTNLR